MSWCTSMARRDDSGAKIPYRTAIARNPTNGATEFDQEIEEKLATQATIITASIITAYNINVPNWGYNKVFTV